MNAEAKLPHPDPREILEAFSSGSLSAKAAIRRLDYQDFADLLIALGKAELPLPGPSGSPEEKVHLARARELLLPILAERRKVAD
jgi:hypothetical protein